MLGIPAEVTARRCSRCGGSIIVTPQAKGGHEFSCLSCCRDPYPEGRRAPRPSDPRPLRESGRKVRRPYRVATGAL